MLSRFLTWIFPPDEAKDRLVAYHKLEPLAPEFAPRETQKASTAKPARGGPMAHLGDGTFIFVADLAPTEGLAFALMNPGKSQICKNSPCPHGVTCTYLHRRGPSGPDSAMVVLLKDGTSIPIADLAPTEGLAFAVLSPGKSHVCKNAPCPHGPACIYLHLEGQPVSASSAKPRPDLVTLRLKDGTSVLLADLAPTKGLSFALMNPGGKARMCDKAPCPQGRDCTFLHMKEQPPPGGVMVQLKHVTPVHIARLAPTQGLAFALMNPGKSQICKNAPCPHGRECIFLHHKEQASAKPGPAMLQLKDGTSVSVAALGLTQGLAFALANPGQSQMCKNPACVDGAACTFLHLRSTSAATGRPSIEHNPKDLERTRDALSNLWREALRQLDEGNPSDALVTELLKIYREMNDQFATAERPALIRASAVNRVSS
jgi:hypothetical protein